MNKQQKKLLILLAILILLVIIIVNIFSVLARTFFSETSKGNQNNYSDSQLNMVFEEKGKYNVSVLNTEYAELTKEDANSIDNTIDFLLDSINNKIYSELYNKLSTSYAEIKFKKVEDFESYMGNTFPYTDYECVSYRLSADNCYVTIRSKQNMKETHKIKLRNQAFSRIEDTEIIFENFNYIQKIYGFDFWSDITLTAQYMVYYADKFSIYMKVENDSDKNAKLDFSNSKLTKVLAGEELSVGTEKQCTINVPAKDTTYVEIFFEGKSPAMHFPSYGYFDIKINENDYNFEMPFIYQEEEEL